MTDPLRSLNRMADVALQHPTNDLLYNRIAWSLTCAWPHCSKCSFMVGSGRHSNYAAIKGGTPEGWIRRDWHEGHCGPSARARRFAYVRRSNALIVAELGTSVIHWTGHHPTGSNDLMATGCLAPTMSSTADFRQTLSLLGHGWSAQQWRPYLNRVASERPSQRRVCPIPRQCWFE
jgi:hypothetical protein